MELNTLQPPTVHVSLDSLLSDDYGCLFDTLHNETLAELGHISVAELRNTLQTMQGNVAQVFNGAGDRGESQLPLLEPLLANIHTFFGDFMDGGDDDGALKLHNSAAQRHIMALRLYQIASVKERDATSSEEVAQLKDIQAEALSLHVAIQQLEGCAASILATTTDGGESTSIGQRLGGGFSWIQPDIATGPQLFLLHVLCELQRQGLRRFRNDCYEEVLTSQGFHTHAWRKRCSIKDFIYECGEKQRDPANWRCMTAKSDAPKSCEAYLTSCSDHEFPDVVLNR